MTKDVWDPGKGARREAQKQAKLLEEQKRKQKLALAEAESEEALVKGRAVNAMMGRRSLISGTQKRDRLG